MNEKKFGDHYNGPLKVAIGEVEVLHMNKNSLKVNVSGRESLIYRTIYNRLVTNGKLDDVYFVEMPSKGVRDVNPLPWVAVPSPFTSSMFR